MFLCSKRPFSVAFSIKTPIVRVSLHSKHPFSSDSVAFEGRLLVIGFASGDIPKMATNSLLMKSASAVGFYWGNYGLRGHPFFMETIKQVTRYLAEGQIKPYVADTFPLHEVRVCFGGSVALGTMYTVYMIEIEHKKIDS